MESIEARSANQDDSRGEGLFIKLPLAVIDRIRTVGPLAFAVYAVLSKHADRKTGECWPSVDTIASAVGRRVRAIQLAIRTLADAKLIEVYPQRSKHGQSATTRYVVPGAINCAGRNRLRSAAQPFAPDKRNTLRPEQEPIENKNQGNKRDGAADAALAWPPVLDCEEGRATWGRWLAYRRKTGLRKLQVESQQSQLDESAVWGLARFIAAVDHSIRKGYLGIYEARGTTNGRQTKQQERFAQQTYYGE